MLRRRLYKLLTGTFLFLFFNMIAVRSEVLYNSSDDFIAKSYEIFLDRGVEDDPGFEQWSYLLKNHEKSLYDYMMSIVSGDEFLSKEITDDEFLEKIYVLLFNSSPSVDEREYWLNKLEKLNDGLKSVNKARIELCKVIFNEPFLKNLSDNLNLTFNFENLNNLGVDELRKTYPQDKIEYINSIYKSFDELSRDLYVDSDKVNNREQFLEYISGVLPIFIKDDKENKYEELKNVSGENVERLVHAIDYEIIFPHDKDKSVYISPFLQMNEGEKLKFVTLGLNITGRSIGKLVSKAEIILGNESIELENKYIDHSKYDSKGISVNEFNFKINSINDLETLDKIISSDLSKLRFTFDDSKTYIYNLYEKDRVKNTLKFMYSIYSQIVASYLFESKDVFDAVVVNSLL